MSLRARLLLGMGAVALVLLVAAVASTRATERNLVRQVDQELERSIPQLRGPRGRIAPQVSGEGPPSALLVAVVNEDRDLVRTLRLPSTLASTAEPPAITAAEAVARLGTGPFTVGTDGSDLRYRAVVRAERFDQVLLFALPLEDVDQAVGRLMAIQALASVAILLALGLVTFWVLRLGVRPVQQMTATATAFGEGDLSARIPDSAPGTEAGELGVALNQMLGRIETAFDEQRRSEDRLRRFVADASHELRTPVTTIRGYAELYRHGGLGDEAALAEAMRRTEMEATRMGDLVADLLALARLDQGRPIDASPVDLTTLAVDAVADARAVDPDRPIELETNLTADSAIVIGDDAHLRQVLGNLVTNARVHTPPGTPLWVRVGTLPDHAVLEVADAGPGMAPADAERAFERFYRADPSRARAQGGSGLGLSIVQAVVDAHGGTTELVTAPGEGTTVRIRLPLAAATDGDGLRP